MPASILTFIYAFLIFCIAETTAQSQTPTVVCIAGQCLQGFSNTTIGATLSLPGAATNVHILPGQYTSTTNPQLLHDLLTSSSTSISTSPGFGNSSSITLPLNLQLQPGLAIFAGSLYSDQSAFTSLSSTPAANSSVPLTARSFALSSNVWAAIDSGSNSRVIFWDSVPDIAQLPSNPSSISLLSIQSNACSPPCASSGICSATGTCECAPGFTGAACESCAPGFFGPSCLPCPDGCDAADCDQGISGTGQCLKPPVPANAPSNCGCVNGVCGAGGACQCSAGFVTGDDGQKCAKCAPGSFLTSTGDCRVCQLGCTQCADTTGVCLSCKSGFSQDANDRTKCNPPQAVTSTGTVCPDGSFGNGSTCSPCSTSCSTCTGGTSGDCVVCAPGLSLLAVANGGSSCVSVNGDGVCEGSGGLIADNNKNLCDSCGAKCTSCRIPNFNAASTVDQLQCTGCLPGFFLSNGKCVESCPAGSFVSPQDSLTCTACDSSCGTCTNTPSFCLTCPPPSLALNGKCISTCPTGTFPSSNSSSCLSCHPDCATCASPSFTQCTSCPPSRPVLSNGRCLPTCSKTQFFDAGAGTCQACDASCGSCLGPGKGGCLSCAGSGAVLRGGACVPTASPGCTATVAGLGVCLGELVRVPAPAGTSTGAAPLPTITGLTTPTAGAAGGGRRLEWWQILLMALGCAFIFLGVVWCWRRRRARGKREERKGVWVEGKGVWVVGRVGWRERIGRVLGRWRWRGERQGVVLGRDVEEGEREVMKLRKVQVEGPRASGTRDLDVDGEGEQDMVNLIGSYQYSTPPSPSSRSHRTRYPPLPPAPAPQSREPYHNNWDARRADRNRLNDSHGASPRDSVSSGSNSDAASRLSAPSMYSQVTGVPRRAPEPRMPVRPTRREGPGYLVSRFSMSIAGGGGGTFWK